MISDDQAEEYLDNLKASGDPEKVRRQIAMNQISGRKRSIAETWLAQLERDESKADSSEHRRIARSAKNAAWAAAIAATIAAVSAVVTVSSSPAPNAAVSPAE